MFFFSAVLAPALLTCVPLPAPAQDTDRIDAVLRITGASSEEDLDEQEVERYLRFLSHPLEINSASRSRLLSSGLLTRYQVASLEEYRSVYGDVLSFSELSLVDGFGEEITRALRPFLSLSSHALPGASSSDTMRTRQDYLARIAYKSGDSNYGIKYRLEAGGRVDFSFAARNSYQDKLLSLPSSWSANITFHSRKRVNRISAWVTGYRNVQKALLFALLQPNDRLKTLQDSGDFTQLMVAQEELKTAPFGEIWDEYCRRCGKPLDGEWYPEIARYEREVLENRQ